MEYPRHTPPSSASQNTTTGDSEELPEPDGDFAFVVHSQESLRQQAAPETDDQRLVRQKRRRTRYPLQAKGGPGVCLLLIDIAAPKIMLYSRLSMRETPNQTRRLGWTS